MYHHDHQVPVVMSFSANDPTGCIGIQADIEALGSIGCHCAPIITAIMVQDTTEVYQIAPTPGRLVYDQARAILEDMPIAGFKIGVLGSVENVRAIHQILQDYPDVPVILDPTLALGEKNKLMEPAVMEAMMALLLPKATMCVANIDEAKQMAPGADTLDACAQQIMALGSDFVLLTGYTQHPHKITNMFYGNYRQLEVFHWDRLENAYLGAGCTLTASLAGLLAQKIPVASAVYQAQEYTVECLKHAYRIGMGQHLPNRLFWARKSSCEYDARTDLAPPKSKLQ